MLWYSLEVPHRGTSNEYHNMFSWRKKKKYFPDITLLSEAMYIFLYSCIKLAEDNNNMRIVSAHRKLEEFSVHILYIGYTIFNLITALCALVLSKITRKNLW